MKAILKWNENQKKVLYICGLLLAAWLGVYGISYVSTFFTADYFSNGVISVLVFGGLFLILKNTCKELAQITDAKMRRHRVIYSSLLALLFVICMIMGYQLRMSGMTESGVRGKGLILIRGLCLGVSVFPFTNYLFMGLEKLGDCCKTVTGKYWKSGKVFLISTLAVFACWIPVFLAYYPAVMAYDFHRQSIEAAKGFVWFNSYQPLAHTWLIWVALQIGKAVGSYEIGMACYSMFQMLVFAVACGYSAVTVYRLTHKKWLVTVLVLFYGLSPFMSIMAISVTKDIMFSALFLIFISLLVERTFLSNPRKQRIIDILWVLEGIVMMLFRNNAIYAVAVFAVVYLLFGVRKQKLKMLMLCLCLVIGGKGALEGMQIVIGTEGRGSKVEMYSIPIQQFSRVGYYLGSELDAETYALLDRYIPAEYWVRYNPALADSVKAYVGAYVFNDTWKNEIPQMLRAWVQIGLKYPNEYIDAFLMVNSGYWFWDDVTWAEIFDSGLENRKGALATDNCSVSEPIPEGIASESKFPALEAVLENIVSANCFYDWPVFSNFFKPALYCWGLLLSFIAAIYNRQRKKIMVILLPLMYLATMFLGPVVQFRYVLPIIVILPLMLAVLMTDREESVE